jgi:prevent-host-death family protein
MPPPTIGSEEARAQLPQLLKAAEEGRSTIITRHGHPIAALVPVDQLHSSGHGQQSLLSLVGSGKGMWGPDVRRAIRELRDEWEQ